MALSGILVLSSLYILKVRRILFFRNVVRVGLPIILRGCFLGLHQLSKKYKQAEDKE